MVFLGFFAATDHSLRRILGPSLMKIYVSEEAGEMSAAALYCDVCRVQCGSEQALEKHSRTFVHTERVADEEKRQEEEKERLEEEERKERNRQRQERLNAAQSVEELLTEDDEPKQEVDKSEAEDDKSELEMDKNKQEVDKSKPEVQPSSAALPVQKEKKGFPCEVCEITCRNEKIYEEHLKAEPHRKNLVHRRNGEPISRKVKGRKKVLKGMALERLIDRCEEPLIGLKYLTEFVDRDPSQEGAYVCNLCELNLTKEVITNHFCGYKHRMNYLKEHYPQHSLTVSRKASRKSDAVPLLMEYARTIEAEEGRQQPKQKVNLKTFYQKTQNTNKRAGEDTNQHKAKQGRFDWMNKATQNGAKSRESDWSLGTSSGLSWNDSEDSESHHSMEPHSLKELLAHLISSEITSEEEASIALQVSNELTQKIFKYRLQNVPSDQKHVVSEIMGDSWKGQALQGHTSQGLGHRGHTRSRDEHPSRRQGYHGYGADRGGGRSEVGHHRRRTDSGASSKKARQNDKVDWGIAGSRSSKPQRKKSNSTHDRDKTSSERQRVDGDSVDWGLAGSRSGHNRQSSSEGPNRSHSVQNRESKSEVYSGYDKFSTNIDPSGLSYSTDSNTTGSYGAFNSNSSSNVRNTNDSRAYSAHGGGSSSNVSGAVNTRDANPYSAHGSGGNVSGVQSCNITYERNSNNPSSYRIKYSHSNVDIQSAYHPGQYDMFHIPSSSIAQKSSANFGNPIADPWGNPSSTASISSYPGPSAEDPWSYPRSAQGSATNPVPDPWGDRSRAQNSGANLHTGTHGSYNASSSSLRNNGANSKKPVQDPWGNPSDVTNPVQDPWGNPSDVTNPVQDPWVNTSDVISGAKSKTSTTTDPWDDEPW